MAIKEFNVDLDVKGRVLASIVPNSTGSIVTWNANTNVFGLRTNAQILSDLGLTSVVSNSHTHSNKSVLDGITSTNVSNWNTAYGWGNFRDYGLARQTTGAWGQNNDFSGIDASYVTRQFGVHGSFFGITNTYRPQGWLIKGVINDRWSWMGVTDHGAISIYASNSANVNDYVEVYHTGNFTNVSQLNNDVGYITGSSLPTNYITTNTNQTGLSGNKTTSGSWTFSTSSSTAVTLKRSNAATDAWQSRIALLAYQDKGLIIAGSGSRSVFYYRNELGDDTSILELLSDRNSVFYGDVTSTGYKKSGQNDTQMLLAGGGHRPVSDFALASDIPNVTGLVPYTGATANVNLGTRSITSTGGFIGNAATASTLATPRTINGTSFNGSANITTARWGTARNITIGNTTKSVNGSGNVSWSLAEIGAIAQNLSLGTSAGQIDISNGTGVTLADLGRFNLTDFDDINNVNTGFTSIYNTTGSVGYPTTTGQGIISLRGTSTRGSFALWKSNADDSNLYLNVGSTTGWQGWKPIATTDNIPTSSDYITTNTNQTGLTGNKVTSGNWQIGTLRISPSNAGSEYEQPVLELKDSGTASGNIIPIAFSFGDGYNPNTFIKVLGRGSSNVNGGDFQFWSKDINHTTINNVGILTTNQLRKAGQTDSSVLLAGGGHKPVSDFALADGYLPLSGGTMTGDINFLNNSYGIAKNNSLRLRFTSVDTFLSSDASAGSNNGIYLRPQGTSIPGGQVSILTDGTIRTQSDGNSSQWKQAYDWGDFRDYGLGTGGNAISDFDNQPVGSMGYTNASTINRPSGLGNAYGSLITFGLSNSFTQIFGAYENSNRLFFRHNRNGVYYPLVEIIHEGNLDTQATSLGFIKSSDLTGYVPTSRTITAGNGLSGGGTLAANRTITLGTPGAITLSSTNSVGTSSHTHVFAPGGTTSQYIRGDGSLATYANTTYSAGTGLSLSGTTFGQAITTSGSGTYVQSITQTSSGFQVNLGTPPNTNTTYSTGSIALLATGTDTTNRVWRAYHLHQGIKAITYNPDNLTFGSGLNYNTSTGVLTANIDSIFAYSPQGGLYTTNWASNALGQYSLAIGHASNATAQNSTAVGSAVFTGGFGSTNVGFSSNVNKSLAGNFGTYNTNNHRESFTYGLGLQSASTYQTVIGRYNKPIGDGDTDDWTDIRNPIFVLGVGQDEMNRKNAVSAFGDGRLDYEADRDDTYWSGNTIPDIQWIQQNIGGGNSIPFVNEGELIEEDGILISGLSVKGYDVTSGTNPIGLDSIYVSNLDYLSGEYIQIDTANVFNRIVVSVASAGRPAVSNGTMTLDNNLSGNDVSVITNMLSNRRMLLCIVLTNDGTQYSIAEINLLGTEEIVAITTSDPTIKIVKVGSFYQKEGRLFIDVDPKII